MQTEIDIPESRVHACCWICGEPLEDGHKGNRCHHCDNPPPPKPHVNPEPREVK